ncbi:adenylate cyclase [Aminobacter niigataensis]|uniref:Adenylate cyclase n=1 Tax=Aminobacter niigataensis TaxID=83265 RepID=A0ABR6KWA9_9HYPH|nr:tetratricopeptide repeat protein [Aminobacter niigataensis]MBB4648762.1 adenylate cyclase [Aminobacter niigataensis]
MLAIVGHDRQCRDEQSKQPMSVFEFAGHTLDLKQGRLRNGAGDVTLRPKSLALLTYLVRNPGRVIDKHELIEVVWPDVVVSDDSLSQCLKDIRVALGPRAEGFIRTVPRRGYILDEQRLRSYDEGSDRPPPRKLQSTADRPSIAVLPFETAEADQEWFSDGIAEDITTALTKSRRLLVVSKNYSFAFKGRAVRGNDIARELRVQYLLEGSVRLSGQRVRVSTRLLEGATGELFWAERFDRDLADIFAIQDEITEAVVKHLELELLPEEKHAIQQARTGNIEAYHYELQGRQLALELTKSYLVLARRLFGKAVELDPGYARAYAGMVICDCYLRDWHGKDSAPDEILAIADKALHLDPTLPEAHVARGFALFCNERYEEASVSYQKALAIDPNSYEANFFFASTMARFLNDRAKMISMFKQASRLRPDDYLSPMMIAAFLARNDPERLDWARICVERSERASGIHPENAAPLHRGAVALGYLGDMEKARSWLARALAIDPDDFIANVNAAALYAHLGDVEGALQHLKKAARDIPQNTIDMLRNDADFDVIRDDPRFSAILHPRYPGMA